MSEPSFFSVILRWDSENFCHVFEVTCDFCGESSEFLVGKHLDSTAPAGNWMINHRTALKPCVEKETP